MQEDHVARAFALLEEIGAEDTDHPSGTLLDHLRGTYDVLRAWDCDEETALAGLYHSVYGTDIFQTVTVAPDARDKVKEAIGEDAERVAYLYCAIVRSSLYDSLSTGGPPYVVQDRRDGSTIEIARDDYARLLTLDLANRLDQVPHSEWAEEQFGRDHASYEAAIPLLPPRAVEEFRRTRVPRGEILVRQAKRRFRRAIGR